MTLLKCLVILFTFLRKFASAGTNCENFRVQPISQLPSGYAPVVDSSYYKKFVDANGILVMGPGVVSDYALKECARIVQGITQNLKPGFLRALVAKKQRVSIWAQDATPCAIPEVDKPCTMQDFRGGQAMPNLLIMQETGFQCDYDRGMAWIACVLAHEFGHAINYVYNDVDPSLQKEMDEAFFNSKAKQLWPDTAYRLTNTAEYCAVGSQSWFSATEQFICDMGSCDKDQLQKSDPPLYKVLSRVFQSPPNWLYKCEDSCDPHDTIVVNKLCQDLAVQPIDQLPAKFQVDKGFYKKFVDADGIPIMGSSSVSDDGLQEAARLVKGMTRNLRDGFLKALVAKKQRVALWAADATACTIPETKKPCTVQEFGGSMVLDNLVILQDANFKCDERGNAWFGRGLVFAFSQAINSVLNEVDKELTTALDQAYANAKLKQLWPIKEFFMSNSLLYYVIGTQTWFEANEKNHCDMGLCDRHQLQAKDPQWYDLLYRVYKVPDFLYICYGNCKY